MPSTSAVAKKSTSGVKQTPGPSEVTPVRISSRVRKEKFSVKELFSQKDSFSEDDAKKTPKKKATIQDTKQVIVKDQSEKITVQKGGSFKQSVSKPSNIIKKPNEESKQSTAGPSKILELSKSSSKIKNKSSGIKESKLEDCIFTENNIESVIENPGALGLDIVVTRLSETETKDSDDSEKTKNVVTISKMIGDTSTKPVKVVPMKPDKKEEKSSVEEVINPDSMPKGLSITPKPRLLDQANKSSGVLSSTNNDLNRNLEKELEDLLSGSSTTTEIKTLEDKEINNRAARKNFSKRKNDNIRTFSNGKDSDNEQSSSKRSKEEIEFGKYFTVTQSLVEHNDSLDSDSETDDSLLSHFVSSSAQSLKKHQGQVMIPKINSTFEDGDAYKRRSSATTVYDLMAAVALELPSWNLHLLQDTGSFVICHVARGPHGLPIMNKIIELDESYSAKVYVNQIYQREFTGVYDSYDAIKELITSVDQI